MATKPEKRSEAMEKEISSWILHKILCRVYAVRNSFKDAKFLPVALGEMANADIQQDYNRCFSYNSPLGAAVPDPVPEEFPPCSSVEAKLGWLKELAVEVGWTDHAKADFVYYNSSVWQNSVFMRDYDWDDGSQFNYAELASLELRTEIHSNKTLAADCHPFIPPVDYQLTSQLLTRQTVALCDASLFVKDAPGRFACSLVWANRETVQTPAQKIYAYCGELRITGYVPHDNVMNDIGVYRGIPLRAGFENQPSSKNA